jgi:hypothetical protein
MPTQARPARQREKGRFKLTDSSLIVAERHGESADWLAADGVDLDVRFWADDVETASTILQKCELQAFVVVVPAAGTSPQRASEIRVRLEETLVTMSGEKGPSTHG